MKKELRQYQTCPDCGKDMGPDHIIGKFVEMVEIFKKDIELNKDQPKKYFEDWLVKKRSVFTAEIHKNHLICNPANFNTINHNGLIYLSVLYHELDIIDQELKGKRAEEWTFPKYLINVSESFAEKLKEDFKTEKGLQIRYMIEALRELNLLVIPNRKNKAFHKSLEEYFGPTIGTYNSIFDSKIILLQASIKDAKKRIKSIT